MGNKPIVDFSIVKKVASKDECKSLGGKNLPGGYCEIKELDIDELDDVGFNEDEDELWIRIDSEVTIDQAGKISPSKVKEMIRGV